jgi:hypothetical protein
MNWPERPTCHDGAPRYTDFSIEWRPPETVLKSGRDGYSRDYPFRTCSYCGSIHPEDLLKVIEQGAILGGSDWKYGWPHKFYIEHIPSGLPQGVEIKVGEDSKVENGVRVNKPIMGKTHAFTWGKWYNEHLKELDDETFKLVTEKLTQHAHIKFERDEKGIKYFAPHRGYQKSGMELS